MKKLLISIMVLGVVEGMVATTPVGTEEEIWYPPLARPRQQAGPQNDNASSDDILLTASSITVIEIQGDSSSAYLVCLETAKQTSYKMADRVTHASIANLLPEPITIAMLGICGFTLRRRKMTSL